MSYQPGWKVGAMVAIIMVLLALLGVALTNSKSTAASTYWVALVPIYGVLCIGTAWARARHDPHFRRPGILRQLFHWLGIGAALGLDFMIRGSGEETATAAGLNAMLLLAVGCYLAGVHLELLFAVAGVLLSVALLVVVKAQEYMWLIFVLGGLTVFAMIGIQWFFAKARAHQSPVPPQPAGS